ncbi:hypothetical protein [Streptomyces sp. MST-110588]|uniref:hypothetical protein n=1 Tax=Streptomyces sp. MST-110588 TaxID=2833628 RepID=UPI001F5CF91D|nr:hypothetical protein [Streptomyces sp. MST-110588]UNO40270.1 hypothetical protein KGS77_12635 [Streptomyces sp. MST-110588]
MADDRYNWLDKDAAERLLRGEPVGGPQDIGSAELAGLLETAAAAGAAPVGEVALPGEEAALAAFRRVRAEADSAIQGQGQGQGQGQARGTVGGAGATGSAGRAGRPRLVRPLRRGFVVALAGCALGGVAVAAGTGVLPTPFRGGEPEPGSSVSAAATPGPYESDGTGAEAAGASQTPQATPGTTRPGSPGSTAPAPGGSTAPGKDGPGRDGADPSGNPTASGGPGRDGGDSDGSQGRPGGGRSDKDGGELPGGQERRLVLTLCRQYENGRSAMGQELLRRLERTAGGADKVRAFCRRYAEQYGTGAGGQDTDPWNGGGRGHGGQGNGGGHGGGNGQGNSGHGGVGHGSSGAGGGAGHGPLFPVPDVSYSTSPRPATVPSARPAASAVPA